MSDIGSMTGKAGGAEGESRQWRKAHPKSILPDAKPIYTQRGKTGLENPGGGQHAGKAQTAQGQKKAFPKNGNAPACEEKIFRKKIGGSRSLKGTADHL